MSVSMFHPGTTLGRCYAVDYVENPPAADQSTTRLHRFAGSLPAMKRPARRKKLTPKSRLKAPSAHRKLNGKAGSFVSKAPSTNAHASFLSSRRWMIPTRKTPPTDPPLKIGLFVHASIKGNVLDDVYVLPRRAVRAGNEVILIDKQNFIRRQFTKPIWSDENSVVIPADKNSGLETGQLVCLTPLAFPANGATVSPTIDGVPPKKPTRPDKSGRPPKK